MVHNIPSTWCDKAYKILYKNKIYLPEHHTFRRSELLVSENALWQSPLKPVVKRGMLKWYPKTIPHCLATPNWRKLNVLTRNWFLTKLSWYISLPEICLIRHFYGLRFMQNSPEFLAAFQQCYFLDSKLFKIMRVKRKWLNWRLPFFNINNLLMLLT